MRDGPGAPGAAAEHAAERAHAHATPTHVQQLHATRHGAGVLLDAQQHLSALVTVLVTALLALRREGLQGITRLSF